MIIQHNMNAANANRQLAMSGTNLAKSTEKLSSGYRINRAADDAAGLAISEKMRGQIRGLDQASTNAQDGISMIQTAEGALSESQSILQRMRELSVQASNGTETDEDRANIQDEVAQLQEELTRISETTEFNTMKLLDGSLDTGVSGGGKVSVDLKSEFGAGNISIEDPVESVFTTSALTVGTAVEGKTAELQLTVENEDGTSSTVSVKLTMDLANKKMIGKDGTEYAIAGTAPSQDEFNKALQAEFNNTELGDKFNVTLGTSGDANKLIFTAKEAGAAGPKITGTSYTDTAGTVQSSSVKQTQTGEDAYKKLAAADLEGATSLDKIDEHSFEVNGQKFAFVTEAVAKEMAGDSKYADITIAISADDGSVNANQAADMAARVTAKTGVDATADGTDISFKSNETSKKGQGISFQIGANEGQTIGLNISNMSAEALGVGAGKVKVATQADAQKATTTIDDAINAVSKERAKLGAVQNRLEHTISNLDTSSENLQTAESRIRDVNMADEMVNYSKHNILQQASQSMLAQAKNSTQGVLSLLQ